MSTSNNANLDKPSPQIQIAALGQFSYCPRRCALMYLENLMVHNEHTVGGTVLHQSVDIPTSDKRSKSTRINALPLYSDLLGLVGKADLVEMVDGVPHPVEFKKGRKSKWVNNYVQLCAQALCLEEMFRIGVPEGSIFNLTTKKRVSVIFTESLIEITKNTILNVRALLTNQITPPAHLKPQCDGCSLRDLCLPKLSDPLANKDYEISQQNLFRIGNKNE